MKVRIEFFGIARSRAGVSDDVLLFPDTDSVTLTQSLKELATRFPALAGECISDGVLTAGFTVNLNGERFVRDAGTPLHDGDCLLLLSADAGG